MSVTELSVKKPIAVIVIVALVLGLGVLGYTSLGADLLPSTDVPFISIVTTYPGASAEEIEKEVVKPIEDTISGISGVDTIRSGASEGYGYTMIQFTMQTKLDTAFMDVQQALGDVTSKLPKDANKPVIRKYNKNSEPVMMLSVSGSIPYDQLYNEVDKIKQIMEKLPGVGGVTLEGAQKKELAIKLDKTALDNYGISVNTVIGKLQSENMNIPAGSLKQDNKNETLRLLAEFQDVNEINNLQIPMASGAVIPLREIANVSFQYPETEKFLRLNGVNSIGVFIQKQSDANIVATTDTIKKELEEINKALPQGIKIVVANDASKFINSTLKEIKRNLIEGIITTTIVMFLFLKQVRASLIVLVAIPTSLIATFFMMYVFKFTLNLMSLMALSLSIGILVDDSIVVLENIQRHLRQGKSLINAAIDGRKEIAMAAISITLCDMVVFGPIAFMSDMVGKFFREFGLTVVFATLFSLIVSFTVTPMLASRLLKPEKEREKEDEENSSSGMIGRLKGVYRKFLLWSLENRLKVISLVVILLIASVSLIPLKYITTEFIPTSDESKFNVELSLKPGSSLSQTDEKVKQVEAYLKSLPEVNDYFTIIGDQQQNSATILVKLKDKGDRKKSQTQLAAQVRSWGKKLSGVNFSVTEESIVGRTSADGSKPVVLNIKGPNKDVLKQVAGMVEDIVKSVPGTIDVDDTINESSNEVCVKLDRTAAAVYGVRPIDIASVLNAASSKGSSAGIFRKDGDEFDITVKFNDNEVVTPNDIESLKLTNAAGQQVQLAQVAQVYRSDSPQELTRMDRESLVTVSANVQGRTLGSITKDIQDKLNTKKVPYGYKIIMGGDQNNMNSSFGSLIKALIASILLVYMILAVLYESFFTPMLRMLSLPCGAIGALAIIAITGKSLNLVTMIGLIMLDGLASKNGTLLIDYTNTLMKRGLPLREALIEAGTTRLRPILMTTVTMIVGMVPSALALSEGSEIKSGMSIALIGGLITSTILSPILIPVVYTLIDDLKNHFTRKRVVTKNFMEVQQHE